VAPKEAVCRVATATKRKAEKVVPAPLRLLPTFAGVFRGLQKKTFVRALVSIKA